MVAFNSPWEDLSFGIPVISVKIKEFFFVKILNSFLMIRDSDLPMVSCETYGYLPSFAKDQRSLCRFVAA